MSADDELPRPRKLFALDQNFPDPIVEVLARFQVDAELVPLRDIDERLADVDDWEVLLALSLHERPWDGLITTDTSILNQPLELSVLIQTKLTLVAVQEAGHNPVKATGLLFAYLAGICKRTRRDLPQLWTPGARQRDAKEPWDALARVADHLNVDTRGLFETHRLTRQQLTVDPLAEGGGSQLRW
jgi:hypothetical protein